MSARILRAVRVAVIVAIFAVPWLIIGCQPPSPSPMDRPNEAVAFEPG